MSDSIVKQMSKYTDYDEEASWDVFKAEYTCKSPQARKADLDTLDQHLNLQTQPTREHASILTRKRELEAIHFTLRGVGR